MWQPSSDLVLISDGGGAAHRRGGRRPDLCAPDGTEYDLGTQVNDDPEQSDGACYTAAPCISADAQAHREILATALELAGLVNYPTEWWHWSYGDRYRHSPRERPPPATVR